VRALAASSMEATAVRARALYCLEQSGSHDLAELRAWTDTSPLLEYFVARGLVQARDYAGITTLFELAESDDQSTATASRWLLAALAGTSPTAEIDAFQQALPQGSTEWHARALPAPAVGF
jgi:hypothetical protein